MRRSRRDSGRLPAAAPQGGLRWRCSMHRLGSPENHSVAPRPARRCRSHSRRERTRCVAKVPADKSAVRQRTSLDCAPPCNAPRREGGRCDLGSACFRCASLCARGRAGRRGEAASDPRSADDARKASRPRPSPSRGPGSYWGTAPARAHPGRVVAMGSRPPATSRSYDPRSQYKPARPEALAGPPPERLTVERSPQLAES